LLATSLTLPEIYEDIVLPPLEVRQGGDWDEWLEAELG